MPEEADPQVRESLVHVAWQTGTPEALPILSAAMRDPDPRVWKEVIDGLVTLGTPEAASAVSAGRMPVRPRLTGARPPRLVDRISDG
jgi:hypothetical protein